MNHSASLLSISLFALASSSYGAITVGLLSDFEDGSTQGWAGGASPTNIATGGPSGVGDNFLQIGNGGSLATFNSGTNFSGVVNSSVTAITVDLMRPATDTSSLDIRLALVGPSNVERWSSTNFQVVANDGNWATYSFSLLESDLTQTAGSEDYTYIMNNLGRILIRHDPGTPSAGGVPNIAGTLGIDNVTAVPEPTTYALLLGLACGASLYFRKKRS